MFNNNFHNATKEHHRRNIIKPAKVIICVNIDVF